MNVIERATCRACLVLGLVLTIAAPAAAELQVVTVNGHQVVANEALVRFRNTAGPQLPQDAQAALDVDTWKGIGGSGFIRIHSRSKTVPALIQALATRPDVQYAEPNYVVHARNTPNDTYFNQQWAMLNNGQTVNGDTGTKGADVRATAAWDLTTGGRSVVIAEIDTGIYYTHPDLTANMWSAPADFTVNIGGQSITCHQGTHGFNSIPNPTDPTNPTFYDTPIDDDGHGSHVAGIMAASGNNAVGVAGMSWTASVMACKFLDSNGSGAISDAINCMEFAIQAKAHFGGSANVRILQNSWGGPDNSQALLDEINKTANNDMLFVVAAGEAGGSQTTGINEDTSPGYPEGFKTANMICVTASDNKDQLPNWADWGPGVVNMAAPGQDIYSTVIPDLTNSAPHYAFMDGTSMAAPFVSGTAALVLSICPLSTADLRADLLSTVDPVSAFHLMTSTGGRLNALKAVQAAAFRPHVMMATGAGQASLWSLVRPGALVTDTYGPYPGWTAAAMATGPTDHLPRVLWRNTNGAISLWTVNGPQSFTYRNYGPYPGWTAAYLAVGTENKPRILWIYGATQQISLWTVHADGTFTNDDYGPYSGWSAGALAMGADNNPRVLWRTAGGQLSLWTITAPHTFSYLDFGPYPGWSPNLLAMGPDGRPWVLWQNTSGGQVSLWTINGPGSFSTQDYGPFPGWSPQALSVDPNGDARLLWDNGGTVSIWNITSPGHFAVENYGPFAGWSGISLTPGVEGQ